MISKNSNSFAESNAHILKIVSLVTLTLQNAIVGLSMRYATTRDGDKFIKTTAVLMAEIVKLITCVGLVYIESGGIVKLLDTLNNTIIRQPLDTLKVCVPSILYLIQNNLLYVSVSHLDAATYQVTYQLKILTTALFSIAMLKKRLIPTQWFSLLTLIVGVVLVQLADSDGDTSTNHKGNANQNRLVGCMSALGACVLSGFAGVYFEKILKGSDVSVWVRNVQLSMLSIPFGIITCFATDGSKISSQGFFFGYDGFIVYLVILQACGGLLVALVVKYADNILKGFATSLAIIISCVVSIYLFDFQLTFQFCMGAICVISAIFLYSYTPKPSHSVPNLHKV